MEARSVRLEVGAPADALRDLDLKNADRRSRTGWGWPDGLLRPGGEILNEEARGSVRVDGLDGGILRT